MLTTLTDILTRGIAVFLFPCEYIIMQNELQKVFNKLVQAIRNEKYMGKQVPVNEVNKEIDELVAYIKENY